MAKKRFPSPANVEVTKEGAPVVVEPKGPVLAPAITAKKVSTTRVQYDGANHVILANGIHHLQKGLNHVPSDVLAESMKHPNLQALKKSGKLTILDDDAPEEHEESESADEGSEE